MDILSCKPKLLILDKNSEKKVGNELWIFPPSLNGEKFILNSNANCIYELCKDNNTIGDILTVFSHRFPSISKEILLKDILKTLKQFWEYQLVSWKDINPFYDDYTVYNHSNPKIYIEKLVFDNFNKFFDTKLPHLHTSPYIKDEVINAQAVVEKQILEGSLVGFILYDNNEIKIKLLLRFDACNNIADILMISFGKHDDLINNSSWFFSEIGRFVASLWKINSEIITFILPIIKETSLIDNTTVSNMGFSYAGNLVNECDSGDISIFNKLLAVRCQ